MDVLMSILGIVVLIAIALLFSNNRRAINWRTVLGAFVIQIGFAALILYVPAGRKVLGATADAVANVIAYGNEGINFVFGGLADPSNIGFIFAVKVLPIIVFFSGLISVLYYLGIMQLVIRIIGGALQNY
ncbi:putative transporter [Rodentibacter pneumotropicus]|uniref:Putative transporter n=1 Tax=Rodentibacter pneumotropicus TaxID=758 RepID=A0A3S5ERX9_9PAST|nr:putative transporter [Rodentibacter pneumotropicus]